MAKDSINIEDVTVNVTCKECNKSLNVQMKRPKQSKICYHCNKGYFHFQVEGVGGKKARIRVHVEFEYINQVRVTIEPNDVTIEE